MFSGYYTIASGILTRQREIDVIGNNLVNSETPGYRADRLMISSFDQELLKRQDAGGATRLTNAAMSTTTVTDEVVSLFQTGTIKPTERNLDVAINGEGFYNVRSTNGTVYLTRNGQFDIDEQGYLCLPGIGRVQGQGGDIRVTNEDFSVSPDGTITGSDGAALGRLLITVPPENTTLTKLDNGMFQFVNGTTGTYPTNFTLEQGSLELSNVNMQQEMTSLIEAQRAYQACSSAMQIIDSLNQKAARELASLS